MTSADSTPVRNNPLVWSLTASVAIVGSNSLALGPIAPDIAQDLATELASILYASAAFGGGTAVSAFFLAKYIDYFGIKNCLLAALVTLTVGFVGSALSNTAWHLVSAQFIAGLAAGVALPACYAGAAVIAPPGQSSRVLGIVLTGWTISLIVGVTLSTLIADSMHWRTVYFCFACCSAAITLYNLYTTLPGKPPAQESISMLRALVITGVPGLLLQVACYMTAFYGVYNLVGDHVVSTLHFPLSANAFRSVPTR
jgi:predicted MFS family arabinose efflux permease